MRTAGVFLKELHPLRASSIHTKCQTETEELSTCVTIQERQPICNCTKNDSKNVTMSWKPEGNGTKYGCPKIQMPGKPSRLSFPISVLNPAFTWILMNG